MGDRSAEKELDGKEYQWKRYALLYLLFSQRRKSDKILAAMMYSIIPEGGVLPAMQPVVECQFCLKYQVDLVKDRRRSELLNLPQVSEDVFVPGWTNCEAGDSPTFILPNRHKISEPLTISPQESGGQPSDRAITS